MRYTIKLPKLTDTADSALVGPWAVEIGQQLAEGDVLFSAETDKIDVDVPTPIAGRLAEQLVAEEDEVPTGAPIAIIET